MSADETARELAAMLRERVLNASRPRVELTAHVALDIAQVLDDLSKPAVFLPDSPYTPPRAPEPRPSWRERMAARFTFGDTEGD